MIRLNLMRHLAARQAPFLLASGLLLGLFQFFICAVVTSVNIGAALQALMTSLPPALRALVETQLMGGFSAHGLLAFGWNHPVSHALGTAAAIVLAVRAVAGEIESGAVELLLSQPLSRADYFAIHVVFALLALALLSLAGMAGTLVGQAFFRMDPLRVATLGRIAGNYFLLQAAWFGMVVAFSAFAREGGRVASLGFMLALVSYFAQVIGRLWPRAAFVLPCALHSYFVPQEIVAGTASLVRPATVLLAVTGAGLVVAAWRFQRRDLP